MSRAIATYAGAFAASILMCAAPLLAQEAPSRPEPAAKSQPAPDGRRTGERPAATVPSPRKLPADSVTHHSVELPGRTLAFQATAGAIPLYRADGSLEAEIAFIAYTLDGAEKRSRPVTFAFNGGPGSASAWLHLGTLGPWRLPLDGPAARPSASPVLVPNAETWLDFTDLVLIDPAGTGFSRVERGAGAARTGANPGTEEQAGFRPGAAQGRPDVWSVAGDIRSIADFVQTWVRKYARYGSPVVLAGESYGGFRVPRLAYMLQTNHGIGVHSMITISPVLDFGALRLSRNHPMANVGILPSLAAAALEAKGSQATPEVMREIEGYAKGDLLADLMRGPRDQAALDRIVKSVAGLTALPESIVRQHGGRIDSYIYRREANRAAGKTASPYDATVTGLDNEPTAYFTRADDPFSTALRAPMTAAMLDLYASRLNWKVDAKYNISSGEAFSGWQWGNSTVAPEAVSQLKGALALDPRTTALVAHGYTDLVTPYFVTTLVLDQVPDYGRAGRVRQVTYPGGHMFYSREQSRVKFRDDVKKAIEEAISGS